MSAHWSWTRAFADERSTCERHPGHDLVPAASNRKGRRGALKVRRLPVTFTSDIRRVITRFFDPGGEARIRSVVERVSGLSGGQVDRLLDEVFLKFRTRHGNIASVLEENYRTAMAMIGLSDDFSHNRRLLIGSYLTAEYSIESAALFNPSIVPHHNQRNLPAGAVRFIMSLRATGEGHVSSIVFRTGVIYCRSPDPNRPVRPPRQARSASCPTSNTTKPLFRRKLNDIGVHEGAVDLVLDRLADSFTLAQLEHAITEARAAASEKLPIEESLQDIRWLAHSNYQLELPREAEASEVVIFPQTSNESHGIEDLRMVRFVDDDGTVTYYGTCTAFDGYRVLPQLIETRDFLRIGVHTINGACAEQGHGAVPAADRRALCDVLPHRRRESLHHGFRHRSLLGDRRVAADAAPSLGVRADRQLRLALGNAGRLAAADPRRRTRCAPTASAPCCWT